MNILKPLPAKYYKAGFENNLILVGVEEGQPQWMGNKVDWANFNKVI